MLKKIFGKKRCFLLAGLVIIIALSGCGNELTAQEEPIVSSEPIVPNEPTVQSESTAPNDPASQPQAETSVTLTDEGKAFLAQMCMEVNDFDSIQAADENFWRDFLFASYTGASSENAATEQVYREDLGFDETVVKVSLQEAQERVKLAFGVDLPDLKPAFEDMEEGQTSFYYQDGYYYIGVSDMPDYQYTFSECTPDQEGGTNTIVKYTADFMGENNVGTVIFCITPENNENGFVIRSKTRVENEIIE